MILGASTVYCGWSLTENQEVGSDRREAIGKATRKDGIPTVLGLLSITGSHGGR